MTLSLADLQLQRSTLQSRHAGLGNFRPGPRAGSHVLDGLILHLLPLVDAEGSATPFFGSPKKYAV